MIDILEYTVVKHHTASKFVSETVDSYCMIV